MGVLAIGIALGVGATTLAIGPDTKAFRPAGTTRYAWASANDAQNTSSTTMVDMPNMSTTITIPAGKKADLFITFSGAMNTADAGSIRAIIDSSASVAAPGTVQVVWNIAGGAAAHGFTFHKVVGNGDHTVKIQWSTLTSSTFVSDRSLMVTANIYP
jgi:hypothetical protein